MKEMDYPMYPSATGPRLQWSTIIAGTVTSLAIMACLVLLGASIGFVAAPAADDAGSLAKGLGIGGSVWMLLSGVVSFYLGGWFASRLSNAARPADGVMFGLVSWATTTIVAMFLVTSAIGGLVRSVMGVAQTAVTTAGQAAAAGAASSAATAQQNGRDLGDQISSAGRQLRQQVDQVRGQSGNQVSQARSQTQQAATEKAETATKAAGAVGFFAFLMMLLEGIAAALGGRMGARLYRPIPIERYRTASRETVAAQR